MLKNWTNLFLFHIKNNKLFTFLNVLGLSIGIAGLIFATLYWNDEQSYNNWNPGKDNVFISISKIGIDEYWASNVVPFEEYFKKDFPELESYCYFDNWYEEAVLMYKNKNNSYSFKKVAVALGEKYGNKVEIIPDNQINASSKILVKGVFDLAQ